jgi:hypothetical protein
MPRRLLLALFALLLQAGCGGGEYIEACQSQRAGEGVRTIVVDPVSGKDELPSSGQSCGPAKTITFVLAELVRLKVTNADVVLEGGTYSPLTEQFPLVIPDGIRLIGTELPGSGAVILKGAGSYTTSDSVRYDASVVLQGRAQLRNVHIQSPATAVLLDDTRSGALVQSVEITECVRGLLVIFASEALISGLHVEGCSNAGIETHDTSAPKFSKSTIIDNAVGVLILDDSQPRFGGGDSGSNTFAANAICDFKSTSSATVNAIDNIWDDDVFGFYPSSQCQAGENLVTQGLGNVVYQYLPHQNEPLFPGTGLIGLLQPNYNAFIGTLKPTFAWTAGSRSNKVALAVWDSQPDVGPRGIRNPGHITLFWHSGLPTGSVGYVTADDMKTPSNGDVQDLKVPVPLAAGRPYYWAVWQWDDAGTRIDYSSEVRTFTIRF